MIDWKHENPDDPDDGESPILHPTLPEAHRRTEAWFLKIWEDGFDNSAQETKMVHEALEFATAPSLEEAADVYITLVGSLAKHGWDISDLALAVDIKMAKNENRVWEQQPDGTYQHVRPL